MLNLGVIELTVGLSKSVFLGVDMEKSEKGIHESHGIRVELRGLVYEISLQHEIPEPRHEERHHKTRRGIVTGCLESDFLKHMPFFQKHIKKFRAAGIQDQVANPDQCIFHHYGLPWTILSAERKLIADDAIDNAAGHNTNTRGQPGKMLVEYPIKHHEADN